MFILERSVNGRIELIEGMGAVEVLTALEEKEGLGK